mgnify:CR=1 FL=1
MSIIKNTNLKIILNDKGNIRKMLDKNDPDFKGFGEIYLTDINFNAIKGWKLHRNKTSNLLVVQGHVKFVAWSPMEPKIFESYSIGLLENESYEYSRITIGPNIWFAFIGLHKPVSRILNLSNKVNNETISENMDLKSVNYKWN